MSKKRILIVSRGFYPIIAPRSFRATELAKEFSKRGHEVTILTHKRDFDYSSFEHEYNFKIVDFTNNRWLDFQGSSTFMKRIKLLLNYLFLFPSIQLSWFLKKELTKDTYNNYDLLVSIAVPYPVHWGVALAKEKNNNLAKTWVADCGDPFMGNKEKKINHPFYFHFVEKWFCNKPDYIAVPVKEAIDAYPVSCQEKIKIIPQGFNFEQTNKNKNKKLANDVVTFGYAGSLSNGIRDPKQFLEYLSKKTEDDFRFILYTKSLNAVKPYDEVLGNKIEIRDYIPRTQLLEEMSEMDFLVNFENKNDFQSPSKLIDYTLTGRPIISISPKNLNEEIVDEFLDRNYKHEYVVENIEDYKIENVVNKFLSLT